MTYRGAHCLLCYTPSRIQDYRRLNLEFVVGIRTLHLLGITFKLTASPYSLYPLSCKPCPTRYVISRHSQFLHNSKPIKTKHLLQTSLVVYPMPYTVKQNHTQGFYKPLTLDLCYFNLWARKALNIELMNNELLTFKLYSHVKLTY